MAPTCGTFRTSECPPLGRKKVPARRVGRIVYQFWDAVIEPILEATRPESIVEIGSAKGANTRNLLDFCERSGATLHAIDPVPGYDVAEWQDRYGERFVFYQDLSLNALPLVDDLDVVLIDGDHNWYTVYNELKLIEGLCRERSEDFPLIMLHDVGWPCARRDMYYVPETIPQAYRKPYDLKGLRPGVEGVLEEGGFFPQLYAVREGGPQNGVLTAVEDFLEETGQQLELLKIPGLLGLGILVPSRLKENAQLAEILETWHLPPNVARHIERVEESALEAEIRRNELRERVRELKARREEEAEILRTKRAELADVRRQLKDARQRPAGT